MSFADAFGHIAPGSPLGPIWLTTAQAAEYLGISSGSLERWRSQGTGPRYVRLGQRIRYEYQDLLVYLDSVAELS